MNIYKLPDPFFIYWQQCQNWHDYKEELEWFLTETESNKKHDDVKIGIMLSHASREAREVYKMLPWDAEGNDRKFFQVRKAFERFCFPQKNIL